MRIIDLAKRQRQRRAAIANALLARDLLRLVQVAEGDVGDGLGKQTGWQRFGVADDDIAFRIFRYRTARHVRVAHGDQRLTGLALRFGRGDQVLMHVADAGHVVLARLAAGDFRRAQKGQGQAPSGHLALGVMQRYQQPAMVELMVREPADAPDGVGVEAPHQRPG